MATILSAFIMVRFWNGWDDSYSYCYDQPFQKQTTRNRNFKPFSIPMCVCYFNVQYSSFYFIYLQWHQNQLLDRLGREVGCKITLTGEWFTTPRRGSAVSVLSWCAGHISVNPLERKWDDIRLSRQSRDLTGGVRSLSFGDPSTGNGESQKWIAYTNSLPLNIIVTRPLCLVESHIR